MKKMFLLIMVVLALSSVLAEDKVGFFSQWNNLDISLACPGDINVTLFSKDILFNDKCFLLNGTNATYQCECVSNSDELQYRYNGTEVDTYNFGIVVYEAPMGYVMYDKDAYLAEVERKNEQLKLEKEAAEKERLRIIKEKEDFEKSQLNKPEINKYVVLVVAVILIPIAIVVIILFIKAMRDESSDEEQMKEIQKQSKKI